MLIYKLRVCHVGGSTTKLPLPLGVDALLFGREVLGAVAATKPSGVFRTGWPTNDQMRSCGVAQLGVSIESEVKYQIVHK